MSAMYSSATRCSPGARSPTNIGYGLQLAGIPDAERKERIAACVAQADLRGFENAYPSALSGGMRQRAALMRTLVVEPQIC